MPVDTKQISELAGKLKNANPQVYEQFLVLLDLYVLDQFLLLSSAPSAEVLQAQGRAQQARKFVQIFTENLDPPSATSR